MTNGWVDAVKVYGHEKQEGKKFSLETLLSGGRDFEAWLMEMCSTRSINDEKLNFPPRRRSRGGVGGGGILATIMMPLSSKHS